MRRILASLGFGLALLSAGISWAAFTTRSTVFDPARSERIAEVLVDSPVVQDAAPAVQLPTERLPRMGGLREPLRVAADLGAAAAALLLAVAFLVASDRPKVLSRMGRWALGAGLWWSIAGYGLPRLLKSSDERLAVCGALGTAVSGPLVAPVGAREAQLDRRWDRRRPVYRRPQGELDAAARHYTGVGGGSSPYPQDGSTAQRNGDTTGASAGRHVAHHRGVDR